MFTSAGRFDRSVKSQQIGLLGNPRHGIYDFTDFLGALAQTVNHSGRSRDGFLHILNLTDGIINGLIALFGARSSGVGICLYLVGLLTDFFYRRLGTLNGFIAVHYRFLLMLNRFHNFRGRLRYLRGSLCSLSGAGRKFL